MYNNMNPETKSHPLVEVNNLSIGYPLKKGEWKVVHPNVKFSLYPGELTCLIGLNGTGKSTLIRTLCNFQRYISGEILIDGKAISEYTASEFALKVGVVLTEKGNSGGLTVYETVAMGRYPHTGFFGRLKPHDKQIIEDAIKSVGIEHKKYSDINELSDGERQRTMIAKALAQQCDIIILDEPTAFLDVAGRMETMALLHKTAAQTGKAILLSTHDMENAMMYADKFILLSKELPIYCDTPENLILNGTMSKFFSQKGMTFDSMTGNLSMGSSENPIGIEGETLTARWLANAMFRNGFSPTSPKEGIININCIAPDNITIHFPEGGQMTLKGITSAVENILKYNRAKARDEKSL